MKDILNRFIRNLIILTVILAIAGISVSYLFDGLITRLWPVILLLIAGITLIIVPLLFSASEKKFSKFSNTFMIASIGKIFLLIAVITGYSFKFTDDAIRFSVTLLVFYIAYLVFEIYWLLKLQNSDHKNG